MFQSLIRNYSKCSAISWRTWGVFNFGCWGTGEPTTTQKLKPDLPAARQVKMLFQFQAGSRRCMLMFNFHPVRCRSASQLLTRLCIPSFGTPVSVQRKGVAASSENIPGSEQLWKEGVLQNTLALPSQRDQVQIVSQAVKSRILPTLAHNLHSTFVSGPLAFEEEELRREASFVRLVFSWIFFFHLN